MHTSRTAGTAARASVWLHRLAPLKGPKFKKKMMQSKRNTYTGGAIDKDAVHSKRLGQH